MFTLLVSLLILGHLGYSVFIMVGVHTRGCIKTDPDYDTFRYSDSIFDPTGDPCMQFIAMNYGSLVIFIYMALLIIITKTICCIKLLSQMKTILNGYYLQVRKDIIGTSLWM